MPYPPLVAAGDHDALAAALEAGGACLIDGLPDPGATKALRADLSRLCDAAALQAAVVGRGGTRAERSDIRGDRTLWLDDPRCAPAARAFLQALDELRVELNRRLYLGLHSVEAHYAAYPPDTGYARHRDRFRDSDARMLSLVSYLNDGWRTEDGGALRLHLDDGPVDIAPHGGISVCFLSELEHEVLPAARERLSIAAWFRRQS